MAAVLKFYSDADGGFTFDVTGSGLGFFGASFGNSVEVGSYQDTTYATNDAGTIQGPAANNIKYVDNGDDLGASGIIGATFLELQAIPNYQSTLNARFTNDTAVQVQNVNLLIYNRTDTGSNASGVTTKIAEILHHTHDQSANGSGDTIWHTASGSVGTPAQIPLAQSPGESGEFAGDGTTSLASTTRHDWFIALSASPDSIGSKTDYGLYVSLEYL